MITRRCWRLSANLRAWCFYLATRLRSMTTRCAIGAVSRSPRMPMALALAQKSSGSILPAHPLSIKTEAQGLYLRKWGRNKECAKVDGRQTKNAAPMNCAP